MDMGDILAQWDKIQTQEKKNQKEAKKNNSTNQISHKKPNAPTLEEKKEAKAREEQKNFARQIQNENSKQIKVGEEVIDMISEYIEKILN